MLYFKGFDMIKKLFVALFSISLVINNGVINAMGSDNEVALRQAAFEGDAAKTQKLIKAGTPVDAPNYGGWTPLHAAAKQGNTAVVKTLLANGVTHQIRSELGTPAEVAKTPEIKKLIAGLPVVEWQAPPLLSSSTKTSAPRATTGAREMSISTFGGRLVIENKGPQKSPYCQRYGETE